MNKETLSTSEKEIPKHRNALSEKYEEAKKIGLVLKTTDASKLIIETMRLAKEISKKPPNTLRYLKRLLKMANKVQLEEFLDYSAFMQATRHNSKEHEEALKKIFSKKNT